MRNIDFSIREREVLEPSSNFRVGLNSFWKKIVLSLLMLLAEFSKTLIRKEVLHVVKSCEGSEIAFFEQIWVRDSSLVTWVDWINVVSKVRAHGNSVNIFNKWTPWLSVLPTDSTYLQDGLPSLWLDQPSQNFHCRQFNLYPFFSAVYEPFGTVSPHEEKLLTLSTL